MVATRSSVSRLAAAALSALLAASAALPSLLSMPKALAYAAAQCSDGIDNDGDGRIDFPNDPDCTSPYDNSEAPHGGTDITASITDNRDHAMPGDTLTYVITLYSYQNQLPFRVNLHLPYPASPVSASDGGTVLVDQVNWDGITVTSGQTRTLTVKAFVRAEAKSGEQITASLTVGSYRAVDTTVVDPIAYTTTTNGIDISLTDNRDFVRPGEKLSYHLLARNANPYPVSSDIQISLPDGVIVREFTPGATLAAPLVIWRNAGFNPWEKKEFVVNVSIPNKPMDQQVLRAIASANGSTSVDETVIKTDPVKNLDISIQNQRTSVRRGDVLTYTVNVSNPTPVAATNVAVSASVPLYGEFVSATDGGVFHNGTIVWSTMNIAANGRRQLQYVIRVRSDAPDGGHMVSSAALGNSIVRTMATIGGGASTSVASQANVIVFRKGADRTEVTPGSSVTYTLYARNTTNTVLRNIVVTDTFDQGYLSLTAQPGNASVSGGQVTWNVGTLAPGQEWQINYVLAVANGATRGMRLHNGAQLTAVTDTGTPVSQSTDDLTVTVMRNMPTTGADLASLGSIVIGLLATASTAIHRRKWLI